MPYYGWGGFEKRSKISIKEGSGVRAARNIGTTWWGEQWLEAFNHISDANRLPRGKTYARNGSVQKIHIEKNKVQAEVWGTSKYKIDIEIPLFTEKEAERITALVAERPELLSALLNRQLPPEMEAACREQGIHLFPRRWNDLKASCSCPDWAMPCKHLAAVIYLIAAEIDKNPFMVFDLHGFDLVDSLQQTGYADLKQGQAQIVEYIHLWQPKKKGKKAEKVWDFSVSEALDFGKIADVREQLLTILSESPVFYPQGDFRAVMKKAWSKVAQYGTKVAKDAEELPAIFEDLKKKPKYPVYQKKKTATQKTAKKKTEAPPETTADRLKAQHEAAEKIRIRLNGLGQPELIRIKDSEGKVLFETTEIGLLVRWLSELPVGRLGQFSIEVQALWFAQVLAETCARKSAVVPQAVQFGEHGLGVRWLPALLHENLREVYEVLRGMTPSNLISLEYEGGKYRPKEDNGFLHLISAFLQFYVEKGADLDWSTISVPVSKLFFRGEKAHFDKFENREYPHSIDLWLSRFFMTDKNTVPVLHVEEQGEDRLAVSLLVERKDKKIKEPVPLKKVLKSRKFADSRLDILRDLNVLGSYFDGIQTLVAEKGEMPLVYKTRDFATVLFEKMPVIRLFGIKIIMPKALDKILRPRLSLRLSAPSGAVLSSSSVSLQNMLNYQWQVSLGDQRLSAQEFEDMMAHYDGLFKLRDEYVFFDENEIAKLAKSLSKPPTLSGGDLLQIALSEEYDGAPIELGKEVRELMRQLLKLDQIAVPDNLQATLRPYQKRGYSWLIKNARLGFGSILADDMGLGKTVQVITALLQLKNEGKISPKTPALAIVPTTLLTNWEKEIQRFAPSLSAEIYHGPQRDLDTLESADILLTSYGIARSDAAKLGKINWAVQILDESQNIKNPNAGQTKAVKKIHAPVRIAMSGTPVENRLSEYWSVFDFANVGLLNSLTAFKGQYAIPIEAERDQKALQRFRLVTQPFVLRRLKTDKSIITDLPDKIEQNQFCHLTPTQAVLYEKTVKNALKKVESAEGIERRGLVLSMIMALKQICNHPTHFLKKGKADPELSGKCPLLLDLVGQAIENDEKTLIFTQFREMGELLQPMLQEAFGFDAPFLHGGVSRKKRDQMVVDFQEKRSEKVLILSLKAGGTGLNLTAASQVVHFDLWWNPAVEAQATDRAFRIGQKRNVQVHRFITQATFEERINEMLLKKKDLADLTVKSGENWIGELSNKELRELFSLK